MQILTYSNNNLAKALSNKYTTSEIIKGKNHFRYLAGYLGSEDIKAQTIVIEDNYMSKDFLHDYASYYALCYEKYPKFCKRVHFFNTVFTKAQLQKHLLQKEENSSDFWKSYLGFVVVKPIPYTVIGYTVLKTYPNTPEHQTRNFWGLRPYQIHFYGNAITLDSLAFQEQDSVLAACATSAIWSMLNKASVDFHTILKSPSQITKDADKVSSDGSRLFPNKGLNLLQMCQAIQNSGLVSEVKNPDYELLDDSGNRTKYVVSNTYLKKIVNAYSSIGIPIILVIQVPTQGQHGLHAITVSGFTEKDSQSNLADSLQGSTTNDIVWKSNNIEKIYAHDDQWGPFARIALQNDCELLTPWTEFHKKKRPTYTQNIIVPLYPKIRISYENIEAIVLGLNTILTLFLGDKSSSNLIWDIKIEFSEKVKCTIKDSNLSDSEKLEYLTKKLPKYLWVASCFVGDNKIFDFTFDATDVSAGMFGKDFICYLVPEFKLLLANFLLNKDHRKILKGLLNHSSDTLYYDFFIQELRK